MEVLDLNVGESTRIDNYIITIIKTEDDTVDILIEDMEDFEDGEVC